MKRTTPISFVLFMVFVFASFIAKSQNITPVGQTDAHVKVKPLDSISASRITHLKLSALRQLSQKMSLTKFAAYKQLPDSVREKVIWGNSGGGKLPTAIHPNNPVVLTTGPEQDCASGIDVCSQSYTQSNSYTGYGTTQEVNYGCITDQETNSVWYIFTAQTSGTFGFTLITSHDYDFALYDLSSIGGCAGVPSSTPIRCNYSADYGNTGMSPSGTNPSEDAFGSPWSTELSVTAGQTYALIVNNYTGDVNGYTLDFTTGSGYASIYDVTPPTLSSVTNNCDNTVTITTSEQIKCSSIDASDFNISPAGFTISSATGVGCSGSNITTQVKLTLSGTPASGTYTINIQSGSDGNTLLDKCDNAMSTSQSISFTYLGPVTISPSTSTICYGNSQVLTATNISGATYAWTPSGTLNNAGIYDPTASPTGTTTYQCSTTYGGCNSVSSATVTVSPTPIVSVSPIDPVLCSGTTTLTASATNCSGCTYQWTGGYSGTSNPITGSPGNTYNVTCSSSDGCNSSNTASTTVSLASAGTSTACNVYYITPNGSGNKDGTSVSNAGDISSLATILSNVVCTGATIKMSVGVYTVSDKLTVGSNTTIEGGYNSTFTTKTSDLTGGSNSTTIQRNSTPDGGSGSTVTCFDVTGSSTDFRFQDLRIEMPGATSTGSTNSATDPTAIGYTNYAIKLGASCSSYHIVRCYVDAGAGSSDLTTLFSENFESCSTGLIGTGGRCNWKQASSNSNTSWHIYNNCDIISGSQSMGLRDDYNSGDCDYFWDASANIVVYDITKVNATGYSSLLMDFKWICKGEVYSGGGDYGMVVYSLNGSTWSNVSSTQYQNQNTTQTVSNLAMPSALNNTQFYIGFRWINDGATGNAPGFTLDDIKIKGHSGTAGSSYAVYSPGAISAGEVVDCEIYSNTSGTGSTACNVCDPSSSGYSNVDISNTLDYPVIVAGDATNHNTNCTTESMNMTTSASSPNWTGSAGPLTGTGSPKTVAYTTTGRKSVVMSGSVSGYSTWTDDFETNKGWTYTADAGRGAIPSSSCGSCISGSPRSGSNVLYIHNCSTSNSYYYGEIQLTLGSGGGTFSGYYKVGSESTYDYAVYRVDGGSWNNLASGCLNSWTAFSFAISGSGVHTIDLGFSTDPATFVNGSMAIYDDVQCTNVQTSNTPTATYTDFNNIITTAPSAGSINSSFTSGCPGTYSFSSSLGNASGYSYSWSTPSLPSGVTSSIGSSNSSSTNISFTNSNSTDQTVTVQLDVTSECCGPLTPVTTSFVVHALPNAPTASAVGTPICPGSCASVNATAPSGCSFEWYDAATGGTLLNSGSSYTVCPTSTVDYYVQAISSNGCISSSRTPVNVVVTPSTPPTANPVSICSPSNVTLSISSPVAGDTYNWYSSSCSGFLASGTSFTTYVSATTTFYVTVTEPGCNESSCSPVTVTITGAPSSETWTGANSTDWFDAGNWNGGCIPVCGTDVSIPSGTTNSPNINFNATYSPAACNSITIANGATLSFSVKGELDVCGDFTQNGTINTGGYGTIVFKGTSTQNFTCSSTASGDLNDVKINNTASPPLLIVKQSSSGTNQNMNIASSLTFQSGIIETEGNLKVAIKNSAPSAVSGGAVNGYVWGKLQRYVSSGNAYDFPVGGNPVTATSPNYPYELMNINMLSVSGGLNDLTVKFENPSSDAVNNIASTTLGPGLPLDGGTEGIYTPLLDCGGTNTGVGVTGKAGIWTILPNAGSASYSLMLYGRNYDNASGQAMSVLKRDTYSECATSPSWGLNGNYYTFSISGNVASAGRQFMSGFSQFAIGNTNAPLPVEILNFNVTCAKDHATVSWATASESNNDHFTLERSCDNMQSFTTIATIPGAGNSTALKQYSYTDNNYPGTTCYYRLSQTDVDGKTNYFKVVAANCKFNNGFQLNNIIPNPASDELHVLFTDDVNENVTITMTDVLGQQFLKKKIMSKQGLNTVNLDLSTYSNGVYFLRIDNGKKLFIKKVVKDQ